MHLKAFKLLGARRPQSISSSESFSFSVMGLKTNVRPKDASTFLQNDTQIPQKKHELDELLEWKRFRPSEEKPLARCKESN